MYHLLGVFISAHTMMGVPLLMSWFAKGKYLIPCIVY